MILFRLVMQDGTVDGTYEELRRETGDQRLVRLVTSDGPPRLTGLMLAGCEGNQYTYRYDGTAISTPQLFALLSGIPGIRDIRMEPEHIESVISGLYQKWSAEAE